MDFGVITNSLKKGFEVWKNNLVAYIVAMLIIAIIVAILFSGAGLFGGFSLFTAIATGSQEGIGMGFAATGIALLMSLLVIGPLMFGFYYMAVKGTRGEKVEIKDLFYSFRSLGSYIRTLIFLIVYFILAVIFTIIPFIGNIIFMILFLYAVYIYIMTPSEGVVYALKESFNIAKDNLIITIIACIVQYILILIGGIFFGLGLLVTLPIAYAFIVCVLKELKPTIRDES